MIHMSGSALSSSTDIRATRSTHSCIASVICGTTKEIKFKEELRYLLFN
jgi:hypothetical protein